MLFDDTNLPLIQASIKEIGAHYNIARPKKNARIFTHTSAPFCQIFRPHKVAEKPEDRAAQDVEVAEATIHTKSGESFSQAKHCIESMYKMNMSETMLTSFALPLFPCSKAFAQSSVALLRIMMNDKPSLFCQKVKQ